MISSKVDLTEHNDFGNGVDVFFRLNKLFDGNVHQDERGRVFNNQWKYNPNCDRDISQEIYFIKDNDRIKNEFNGLMHISDAIEHGMKNIQIQSIVDNIGSEWRVFIHNGVPCDIKNYSGNPFLFPDVKYINKCVDEISYMLKEGTIGVYVDEMTNKTYVVEAHKFFSCGLYGFSDNSILPIMLWRTFKSLIKK